MFHCRKKAAQTKAPYILATFLLYSHSHPKTNIHFYTATILIITAVEKEMNWKTFII